MGKADEVVVVFAGYNYEGDVTSKVEFSEGSSDTSINDKDFEVPGVCKFAFYKKVESTGFSYINPSGQTPSSPVGQADSCLTFLPRKVSPLQR